MFKTVKLAAFDLVSGFCSPCTAELRMGELEAAILILKGDFNVSLNPLLDTSSGTSAMSYRALKNRSSYNFKAPCCIIAGER